jgi:hypothetical protein
LLLLLDNSNSVARQSVKEMNDLVDLRLLRRHPLPFGS